MIGVLLSTLCDEHFTDSKPLIRLYALLKTDVQFRWSNMCQNAFDVLKQR